jgi:hypothetical protein
LLAEAERRGHLATDDRQGEAADGVEWKLELDLVAQQRAGLASFGVRRGRYFVAVVPEEEWATEACRKTADSRRSG